MSAQIHVAESDQDIERCFPVMQQLRPHLLPAEFVPTVRRQQAGGFRLAFVQEPDAVRCVAGYRVLDNLVGGRILYVDDLVTDSPARSSGHGAQLFDWLVAEARREGCRYLELDSGVQRFEAHRFYLRQRMILNAHHFRLEL